MTREIDDGAIARIVRAFDAVATRFAHASSFDEQEDETSNLLHHLNRLMLARYGDPQERPQDWATLSSDESLQIPLALRELRHVDVHGLVRIAVPRDSVSGTVTNLVGTLTWDIADAPQNDRQRNGFRRKKAVSRLDQQPVFDSLAHARNRLTDE